jgi:hypothetical protein
VVTVISIYHSGIWLEGLGKTMKTSIKITDVPVEIRREQLPNTILSGTCYLYGTDEGNSSSHYFPLDLEPNSGLGHLHETFRFTSVTRYRTVCRTPWTGDQLVARPLPVHKHRKRHTQHKY